MKQIARIAMVALVLGMLVLGYQSLALAQTPDPQVGDLVALGKALFFDTDLPANGTQSCATCQGLLRSIEFDTVT